jgi:single-strand DNA-binding protein
MLKLLVIGHLGKDATVNVVNGKNVINFTVAHTEKYKDAQGVQIDKTTWVDCAYWTERTAIAPYLKKGTQVYTEGTPDIRTYTTSDGRNSATITLRVQSIQLVGAKTEGSIDTTPQHSAPAATVTNYQQPPAYVSPAASITEPADDLPF